MECVRRIDAGTIGVIAPSKACLHRLRLALIGNNHEYLLGLENLAWRHRDSALRHLRNVGKPGLAYLLPARGFVEVHDEIRIFSGKVGGRIVEGDVPVFPDAEKCNVDGR